MEKVLEEIPINIKNQHKLLNLLAESYKSLNKALMEYIDNSFDSADDFYNEELGIYTRDIHINIVINRKSNCIFIEDNCSGMNLDILRGLANNINESEKKRREQKRAWVNGQFGLGAHAFRFFAETLIVTSKEKNNPQISIMIDRDNPNARLIKTKEFPFLSSGTLVEVRDVERNQIKNLDSLELKKEIEIYFEMLIKRNVVIKILDGQLEYKCEPFDYEKLSGIPVEKIINSWTIGKATKTVPIEKGIIVNLKVCEQKIDRPPFFSRKGRKINIISNMDSFIRKTEHRKKVWENYYLTGYIEVGENLEPVLSRDDFVGGRGRMQERTAIYTEIIKLEDDIFNAIEIINKNRSDESFRNLAVTLTDLLSKLAREEEIRLKYQNDGDQQSKQQWQKISQDTTSLEQYEIIVREGDGEGGVEGHKKIINAIPDDDGGTKGKKITPEKEGIRIEFSTLPSADKRSYYGDGIITIFTQHPDFENRKSSGELEQMIITPRLASYLSAVISSEYKEIFYQQKKLEPDRKAILEEQIDFIFRFEQLMKDIINLPLDSIGMVRKN